MTTRLCILAVAAAAVLSGCGHYQTLKLEVNYRADSYLTCKSTAGLFVAGESLFDTTRSEKYLYHDLKEEGFVPIVLFANNRGENSYLLSLGEVTLILTDGTELTPVSAASVYESVGESKTMMLDYLDKDFFRGRKGIRIGAGNNVAGVLFFTIPKNREITAITDAVVKLNLTREKGQGQAESQKVKMLVALE